LTDVVADDFEDDDIPHYLVRVFMTEDKRTIVCVPELNIELEGSWRFIVDAESAAVEAIEAKLQTSRAAFRVNVDCPIDMDPEISPEFKAELERCSAEHDARPHDWQPVPAAEAEDDLVVKIFKGRYANVTRCMVCGALSFES